MTEVLKNLSDELAAAVEAVSASTVRVESRRRLPATGIVWSAEEGEALIVTAHHIVERPENIGIGLPDGETIEAEMIGRDPNSDLALLRVNAGLTPANWAEADDLKVGSLVLALGRPGREVQATLGVISAVRGNEFENELRKRKRSDRGGRSKRGDREERSERGRRERRSPREFRRDREFRRGQPGREYGPWGGHGPWRGWGHAGRMWRRGNFGQFIQTDVTMYPGFSGGPLVDASGLVRGMNTSGFRGASLAVPTTTIRNVADTLIAHGRMRQGFLGVGAQPVRLPDAIAEELEQETGLLLVSVEENSPAENSGLMVGDIIVSLDGEPVTDLDELLALLSGARVGKEVITSVVRGGELVVFSVTIGERM